jgi:hypothetical protein
MSEREGSQRDGALSEREGSQRDGALSEREGSQRERGSGPRRKREAFSSGPATRAVRTALAPDGPSEERG